MRFILHMKGVPVDFYEELHLCCSIHQTADLDVRSVNLTQLQDFNYFLGYINVCLWEI